jgi:hypothetical protein
MLAEYFTKPLQGSQFSAFGFRLFQHTPVIWVGFLNWSVVHDSIAEGSKL